MRDIFRPLYIQQRYFNLVCVTDDNKWRTLLTSTHTNITNTLYIICTGLPAKKYVIAKCINLMINLKSIVIITTCRSLDSISGLSIERGCERLKIDWPKNMGRPTVRFLTGVKILTFSDTRRSRQSERTKTTKNCKQK